MTYLKPEDAAAYRSLLVFAIDEAKGKFGPEYRFEVVTPGMPERRTLSLAKTERRLIALAPIRQSLKRNGVAVMRVTRYQDTYAIFNDWPEWDQPASLGTLKKL